VWHIFFSRRKNFKAWAMSRTLILLLFRVTIILFHLGVFSSKNFIFDINIITFNFLSNSETVLFFAIVRVVSVIVFYWGAAYIRSRFLLTFFFITLTMFVTSMLLLSFRSSLLSIFLGWEGLGVTSFFTNYILSKLNKC